VRGTHVKPPCFDNAVRAFARCSGAYFFQVPAGSSLFEMFLIDSSVEIGVPFEFFFFFFGGSLDDRLRSPARRSRFPMRFFLGSVPKPLPDDFGGGAGLFPPPPPQVFAGCRVPPFGGPAVLLHTFFPGGTTTMARSNMGEGQPSFFL